VLTLSINGAILAAGDRVHLNRTRVQGRDKAQRVKHVGREIHATVSRSATPRRKAQFMMQAGGWPVLQGGRGREAQSMFLTT